jgi:hypothetical protein
MLQALSIVWLRPGAGAAACRSALYVGGWLFTAACRGPAFRTDQATRTLKSKLTRITSLA